MSLQMNCYHTSQPIRVYFSGIKYKQRLLYCSYEAKIMAPAGVMYKIRAAQPVVRPLNPSSLKIVVSALRAPLYLLLSREPCVWILVLITSSGMVTALAINPAAPPANRKLRVCSLASGAAVKYFLCKLLKISYVVK